MIICMFISVALYHQSQRSEAGWRRPSNRQICGSADLLAVSGLTQVGCKRSGCRTFNRSHIQDFQAQLLKVHCLQLTVTYLENLDMPSASAKLTTAEPSRRVVLGDPKTVEPSRG